MADVGKTTIRATMRVEVAYAEPQRQFLRALDLPVGVTVAEAIAAAGLAEEFLLDTALLTAGIWSKPVARNRRLDAGDRVELYRPLKADPKESRRRRARHAPRHG